MGPHVLEGRSLQDRHDSELHIHAHRAVETVHLGNVELGACEVVTKSHGQSESSACASARVSVQR